MRRILALLLFLPALCWGADRCVSDIGTRTSGSCASTCNATDFATAATCYNSAAQGSSSVTTALTQSTADGDTVTIDDGIHSITTNILASSMTGPNPGTVTIRCRTATRGSCGFTQSSATAANFSLGNATIAVAFVIQNLACTKSIAHTSTSTAICFHAVSAGNGNITLDSVYMHDITYNVGTSTSGALTNFTSANNKTLTIQGTTLVENITVNGTAVVPGVISILTGTNDLAVTGLTARNITGTDVSSMFSCADDCDVTNADFSALSITDTDAVWHGVIDATDTALSAAISDVWVADSTFRLSVSTSLGAILGKFQGPATVAVSGCTGNTVTLISGRVATPLGPCYIAAGANASVVASDSTITGNTAPLGLCGYANQGGALNSTRIKCMNNTVGQGLYYCGGWGACTLSSSIFTSNTQDTNGEGVEGFVFLCQLQSTATAARTCRVYNNDLSGNTLLSSATGSVYFRNNDTDGCAAAPCVQTMLATNNVVRNGKTNEIVTYITDAAATDVLTLITNDFTDATSPTVSGGGSGAVTLTNTGSIQTDPQYVCTSTTETTCRKTKSGSPLRRTGTVITGTGAPVTDFFGRTWEMPRDIGPGQSGGGYQASSRTARN